MSHKISPNRSCEQAKAGAKAECELLAIRDSSTKAEMQSLAKSLQNNWKLGIGAPPVGKGATTG